MMKGFFKNGCPIIRLKFEEMEIDFLLDSGFNGHVMLPKGLIKELSLKQIGISDFTTASGERNETKVYKGKINLHDKELEIPVISTESNFSLAGMDLFHDCKIIIERSKGMIEISKS